MFSGTQAQSFLTPRRPHENDSCFKSILRGLQHFGQLRLLYQEACSHGVVFTLCLTKGFQWQEPGRENSQDLGRNSTYKVSFFLYFDP